MFTREQRFAETDLIDFMDGIGEEQNEFHQEEKQKVKIENRKSAWYEDESNIDIIINEDTPFKPYKGGKVLPYEEDPRENLSGLRTTTNSPVSMMYVGTASSTGRVSQSNNMFMDEIEEESAEEEVINQNALGRAAKYV